jgi:hypothetical protein
MRRGIDLKTVGLRNSHAFEAWPEALSEGYAF